MMSRLSPTELLSHSKLSHSALINVHTWGCPLYVLQYQLQYGGKLPKWEPWSRRGKYMGVSPLHDSTFGIICSLNKNRMSSQFHIVSDNLFQTVHSDEGKPPAKWPDLIVFDHFQSDFYGSDFSLD